jgi:hypothetical protein
VNIRDYITSGEVESYVLGLSTEQERIDFEQRCHRYPELVSARNDFEMTLERLFLMNAYNPVAAVKEKIMQAVRQDSLASSSKIIRMDNSRSSQSGSSLRWVAVAAVLLLLASAYFAFNFYTRNKDLKQELARSKDEHTEMADKLKTLEMVSDPNVAVVNMKGTEKAPQSSASVYWDSTSANVYLVVKNMPKLASDKQYQLWALINGQPKDLGLFDVEEDKKLILKMNNTQKADAFAITIESRGNKGGPTLEDLQTMGKTNL